MRTFATGMITSVLLSSAFAANAKTAWVGRLTDNLQCEEERYSTLGQAVAELEKNGVQVHEARVTRVADRMFCSACGCPEGTFNAAKVEMTEDVERTLQKGDWEVIKPYANTNEGGHGDFRILPVNPPVETK